MRSSPAIGFCLACSSALAQTIATIGPADLGLVGTGWSISDDVRRDPDGGAVSRAWTVNIGDRAVFSFVGTALSFVSWSATNQGRAQIVIDGGDPGVIDCHATATVDVALPLTPSTIWRTTGLGPGRHTATVSVTAQDPRITDPAQYLLLYRFLATAPAARPTPPRTPALSIDLADSTAAPSPAKPTTTSRTESTAAPTLSTRLSSSASSSSLARSSAASESSASASPSIVPLSPGEPAGDELVSTATMFANPADQQGAASSAPTGAVAEPSFIQTTPGKVVIALAGLISAMVGLVGIVLLFRRCRQRNHDLPPPSGYPIGSSAPAMSSTGGSLSHWIEAQHRAPGKTDVESHIDPSVVYRASGGSGQRRTHGRKESSQLSASSRSSRRRVAGPPLPAKSESSFGAPLTAALRTVDVDGPNLRPGIRTEWADAISDARSQSTRAARRPVPESARWTKVRAAPSSRPLIVQVTVPQSHIDFRADTRATRAMSWTPAVE